MWFFIPIKKNSYRQSSLTVRVLRSLNHHPVTDASILFFTAVPYSKDLHILHLL